MKQQTIPHARAIAQRVLRLTPRQYNAMATLGLQELYRMGQARGLKNLSAYVSRRLAKLAE